ncbi:hypothetical protein BH23CHL1_BH23CHL1_24090 [soil metagenome]
MTEKNPSHADPVHDERPEPPVSQLADVPPEDWDYSTAQAFAGCGVIGAVMLALLLPTTLRLFVDSPLAEILGFGVAGLLALVCVGIITRLTRAKRAERRARNPQTDPDV